MGEPVKRLDLVRDDDRAQALRPRTVAELRKIGAPRWLIRSLLKRRALTLLWGASGTGKTFVSLDLAFALVLGHRWNGLRTAQGGVIYVAAEGHLSERVEALMKERGLSDGDLDRFRVVTTNVNLLDAGADLLPLTDEIKKAAAEIGGIAAVFLDTLNAMMPGGDENASEDMGAMVAAARLIMEQAGCSVVFVHHCGKDEGRGARGHSSLRAAVDTEIVVRDGGTFRSVTVEKQRDGETGAEWAFRLHSVDLGASDDPDAEDGERRTSCVIDFLQAVPTPPPRQEKRDIALEALKAAISDHGERMPGTSSIPPGVVATTLDRWQARFRLMSGDDYRSDDSAGAAFRRARGKLLTTGAAACSGTYAWLGS